MKRKIIKPVPPQDPQHNEGVADGNNKKNGTRGEQYAAPINEVIIDDINGVQRQVPVDMQVYFKALKSRKNQSPDLPVTLAKLEVVNSELWGFLLGRKSDSKPFLVVDPNEQNKIVGVATKLINNFKDFKNNSEANNWDQYEAEEVAKISMTIAIVADDDNHKENIGKIDPAADQGENARPALRKIDHEYFFYDELFSRIGKGSRNFLHPFSEARNHLDSEDIDNFPLTTNYRPHYWWSKPSNFSKSKNYNERDKMAMEAFAQNPNFQKAAYSQLLNFILTPKSVFETIILQHLDREDPLFPLILNAWVEQQATLRIAAMGSRNFRESIAANHHEYQAQFVNLIQEYREDVEAFTPGAFPDIDPAAIHAEFVAINNAHIGNGDTSLHAVIRARQFRFDESMKWHSQNLHTKNAANQTPLELAITLGNQAATASAAALPNNRDAAKSLWDKVSYYQQVARFLANQGAVKPDNFHSFLQRRIDPSLRDQLSLHDRLQDKLAHGDGGSVRDEIENLSLVEYQQLWADSLANRQNSKVVFALQHSFNIENSAIRAKVLANGNTLPTTLLTALELSLIKLRDNTDLTLKMKKDAAILAFETVLPHLKSTADFEKIIEILDKKEYQFMQQLTSRLEIVRRFRGLYGVTSTYKTIADAINKQLNEQLHTANPHNDKTLINQLQQRCTQQLHTFFARHTKLVRQLKPIEVREIEEQAIAAPGA